MGRKDVSGRARKEYADCMSKYLTNEERNSISNSQDDFLRFEDDTPSILRIFEALSRMTTRNSDIMLNPIKIRIGINEQTWVQWIYSFWPRRAWNHPDKTLTRQWKWSFWRTVRKYKVSWGVHPVLSLLQKMIQQGDSTTSSQTLHKEKKSIRQPVRKWLSMMISCKGEPVQRLPYSEQ